MIREASIEDLRTLLDWRMETLSVVFEGEALTGLRAANEAYYRDQLGTGHLACFALEQGEIVGCGGICLQKEMPSPDNPSGLCGYLMNIYVRPAWRHQGHAAAIVDWLCDQAKERGCEKLWLETSGEGRGLYETLGFQDLPDILVRHEQPETKEH